MQQKAQVYSHSLKRMTNLHMIFRSLQQSPRIRQNPQQLVKLKHKKDIRNSYQKIQSNREQYQKQMDSVVKAYVKVNNLPLQLPPIKRKQSYRNYRIKSQREAQDQFDDEVRRKRNKAASRVLTQANKEVISKIQKQINSKMQGGFDQIKHYRMKSLKKMQLHFDVEKIRKWHQKKLNLQSRRYDELMNARKNKKIPHI